MTPFFSIAQIELIKSDSAFLPLSLAALFTKVFLSTASFQLAIQMTEILDVSKHVQSRHCHYEDLIFKDLLL